MRTDPSKPIRAGDLPHVVAIVAPAGTVAASESIVEDEVAASIVVVPITFQAPERFGAGGVQSQTAYTVSMRYRTDLRASFVFRERCCTQREFYVRSIVPSDRRDAVDCRCVTDG